MKNKFHHNRVELAVMSELFFARVGQIFYYVIISAYLFGDLAIYAVGVPTSLVAVVAPSNLIIILFPLLLLFLCFIFLIILFLFLFFFFFEFFFSFEFPLDGVSMGSIQISASGAYYLFLSIWSCIVIPFTW
jgi:hypothetical protein